TPVRGRRRDAGATACDSGDADGVNALISRYVPSGAKVLDLGCGSGDLLSALARDRQASGFGVDRDLDSVIRTMDRGHSVFQADLDRGLSMLPAGSYDCAVLSGTLQQVRRPRMVILEMLRVAREGIVVFPNFAHWKNRFGLALRGRMPKSQVLPYEWYETPNIHLATLTDVLLLCEREGLCVLDTVCIHGCLLDRLLIAMGLRNLGARRVLLRLAGRARPCAAEAET
ncbi:MAG: methionine biosynthesis protein MetW, partial [Lentisphaerae bacterium]|nr:methionine biosynthesis protein MetW [Lentisphaerota bacterium]